VKKSEKKDSETRLFNDNKEQVESEISKYKVQIKSQDSERGNRIKTLKDNAVKTVDENTKRINSLQDDYVILEGNLTSYLLLVDSRYIDIEKDIKERFLQYHLRDEAKKEIDAELLNRSFTETSTTSD